MSKINNMKERLMKVSANQDEAKLSKIYNGTADLTELLNAKDIDMTKCERPITMMQLIYSAGSEVGPCTVRCMNEYTIILNDNNCKAFKKSLLMLKENDEHVPYESVWIEGINKFSKFNFKTGENYIYYLVNDEQIKELARKIKAMDIHKTTLEELKQLQKDLPPFIRAWQESSIDYTKDKSKKFTLSYKDFFSSKLETKIITVSNFTKTFANEIKLNLNEMREAKNAGEDMSNKSFKITMPHESVENVHMDTLGAINVALKEATENHFNDVLKDIYTNSNFEAYSKFEEDYEISRELALYIKQIFVMCNQSYYENVKITKEQYATMRNAIYTKAVEYGVDPEDVINIAISVCMNNITINEKGMIVISSKSNKGLKLSNIEAMFRKEYKYAMTNTESTIALNIEELEREIEDDEEIEFINGYSIDRKIKVEENFTGIAYECNGELVYSEDIYAYEETKAVLAIETYTKTNDNKNLKSDLGVNFNNYINETDEVQIVGNNNNALVIGRNVVAKLISAPEFRGQHDIVDVIGFDTKEKQQAIFLVVLN